MTEQQQWTDEHIETVFDQDFMEYQGEFWSRTVTAKQITHDCRDDMQSELDAAQARIAELERERNYHIERANEMRETLQVLDETRSTCSAAWDEINSEVERINEADRLERLGG